MTRVRAWHASCDIYLAPGVAGAHRRRRIGTGAGEYTPGERRGRMSGDVRPLFYVRDLRCVPDARAADAARIARWRSARVADAPRGAEQGGSVGSPRGVDMVGPAASCVAKRRNSVTRGLLCAPGTQSATPQGVSADPLFTRPRSTARSCRSDGVTEGRDVGGADRACGGGGGRTDARRRRRAHLHGSRNRRGRHATVDDFVAANSCAASPAGCRRAGRSVRPGGSRATGPGRRPPPPVLGGGGGAMAVPPACTGRDSRRRSTATVMTAVPVRDGRRNSHRSNRVAAASS